MSSFPAEQPLLQTATAAGWDPYRIRDVLLAVLAFGAGSIDVMSWLALGKVFCAFMTGNVVFLAAGLFEHQSELSLHAAVALCAFGAGAWATAWVMPREDPSVLWPARVTAGLIACALVQLVFWLLWLAVGGHPGSTLMVLLVPPSGGPAFGLVKSVQGNLDSAPKYSPGIGTASPGGSGTYTLTWTNTGGKNLTNPVIYDVLPYVGDTGVSQGQAGVARGSQFAPIFTGISAALPSGVTVAYSQSSNPCRPEVYPNAANAGCVNDWTTTPPTPLGLVKALRFTATGTYTPAQSFAVNLTVQVPAGYVNTVAWNTAASDASYNGTPLLPAEPPKVGLTAVAPPLTPTLSTTASSDDVTPGDSFSDSILVGNTGGANGTLGWKLLGPIAPTAGGTCAGLDWSSAATPTAARSPSPATGPTRHRPRRRLHPDATATKSS